MAAMSLAMVFVGGNLIVSCRKTGATQAGDSAKAPAFTISPTATASICGKLDDHLVHVPPSYTCGSGSCAINPFPPPSKGGSYVDPQFGCTVKRLTDAVGDGLGTAAHHDYSTITPINANDTYVMINLENGSKEIVDTSGGVIVSVTNMPQSTSQQLPWDRRADSPSRRAPTREC